MSMGCKSYEEMLNYDTYETRLRYLMVNGSVGEEKFGSKRWINQKFYTSIEWRNFRRDIILRDNGCDMALPDYEIYPVRRRGILRGYNGILIHHINPCSLSDFDGAVESLLDPNNVVCVSYKTHQMIHYGLEIDVNYIREKERAPNDTCLWERRSL